MGQNKHVRVAVILLVLLTLFISLQSFLFCKHLYNETKIGYVDVVRQVETNPTEEIDISVLTKDKVNALREKYHNNDIVGILTIEGTGINEPILKYYNNDYYLNHNAYGDYQAEGSVYEDYRTNLTDKKVLIFGHSSPGWVVPFNELEKYYDKNFYDNHKYIEVTNESSIRTYEIFSVLIETSDFTYMNLNISDDTYNSYLRKYQDKSMYKTITKVNDGDEIIILQTCSNKAEYQNYNKKFLLVIAKKIREVK